MGDQFFSSIVTVATAIVGVAIIAVIVSQRSQTSQVITSAGSAFAQDIAAAVSPVTGGSSGFSGLGAPYGGTSQF